MVADNTAGRAPFITEKGRDLRLDLLRGYCVLAMVVDHVAGASPLWLLTGGNRFFTGAAEGFVLTSGLVAGLVYARLIRRDGLARSLMKVLNRAFTLYLVTLALTLLFLPLSEWLHLPWAEGLGGLGALSTVVSILTLHRTYFYVDVMLLYTILFALMPLALVLMDQGKRWWVLGASWLLWGLFQLWPNAAALPWPIAGNYLFHFSAWQVIFFTGVFLGYGRQTMPLPEPRKARLLLALSGVALLALIALYVVAKAPGLINPVSPAVTSSAQYRLQTLVDNLFLDKVNLRPGRLLATGVTFGFLFLAATVFWQPVRRLLGWLLLSLGQHALYAYTAHVGLVALAALAVAPLGGSVPRWLNALIQTASVALIWVLIRFRVLSPTPRTQRLYYLSPLLFAVLAWGALHYLPAPDVVRAAPEATPAVNRFGTPLPPEPDLAAPAVNRFGTPLPPEPDLAAPAVNRFGTPLPPEPDLATPTPAVNRFGTPLPPEPDLTALSLTGAGLGTPAPVADSPTARPAPAVEVKPADPSLALTRVASWVGPLEGTLEERWFNSSALGREVAYWVYLPPGYSPTGERYPVLYLLHGAGGHRDEWISFGVIEVADREMAAGRLAPMIIILPQGDQGFWVNHAGGGTRWGDYVTFDLVAQVDGSLQTLRQPAARAIGGLSMGGFGALTLAFMHPDVFAVVGAHTPSLHPESSGVAFLGQGDDYAQRDPISLARTLPGLDGLRIWIDIDTGDNWLSRAQELHDVLDSRGIAHTWQILPGTHEGEYWTTHVIDYLRFYGEALAAH